MDKSINAQKNRGIEKQKTMLQSKIPSNVICSKIKLGCQTKSKIKILIVEDNQLLQFALQAMLKNLGFKADIAPDGKTALSMYSDKYCLILMDIDLPDISGIEVAKVIRSIEKTNKSYVPIVAMTSHSDEPDYQEQFKKAGMDGCSGKPDAAQLKALIETYASE